ncbi:hypothetical protein [Streptomyces sp. ISL-11]|uniref:hypothetical protein n=1 Tax=Streptomyces sp. ISL-11 TaxID=2819174 RepID=UPI001BEA848E|nr:hypothetical protein [Streptomyces sp. ISL-11]MBT2385776.1 hypothetical protein [Streptomyces sp. ISL-11]
MTAHDPDVKKDLAATLETRKELGPEYEAELVDSFLANVDRKIDQKVDSTVDRQVRRHLAERQMSVARGARPRPADAGPGNFGERFGFAAISLVLAIPLSAIGVVNAHLPGLLVTWAGIVGVNALNSAGFFPWPRSHKQDAE